jgi:hypothetical protein
MGILRSCCGIRALGAASMVALSLHKLIRAVTGRSFGEQFLGVQAYGPWTCSPSGRHQ